MSLPGAPSERLPGWLLAERSELHSLLIVELLDRLGPDAADEFARRCQTRMAGRRDHPDFYTALPFEFADQLVGEWWVTFPMDAMDACEALIELPEDLAVAEVRATGASMVDMLDARRKARRVEVCWCYGELAKVSGATDAAALVVESEVSNWPGTWSDLLELAERLTA